MAPILLLVLILVCAFLSFVALERHFQLKKMKASSVEIKKELVKEQRRNDEFSVELLKTSQDPHVKIVYDSLTGLPGRAAFEDRLAEAISQCQRFEKSFALLFLDIDKFSVVNNTYGYDVGDKVLKEIAKRLQIAVRQVDFVTRYGGNKFLILLPQLSIPETAVYVAQRVLDSIVSPFNIDGQELFITIRVGVAVYPSDGTDAKTLLQNADNALHQAKIDGGNKYQFYRQEMHAMGQRELKLHACISGPDLLDRLVIFYQPIININTNQTAYVKAILHLDHPDLGLIPFSEFARVAENCGKIVEVGEWLLTHVLAQFQKWHTQQPLNAGQLVINLTMHQIENPQFFYRISQLLKELSVDAAQLVFEISEDKAAQNSVSLEKAFATINQLGVKTSVGIFALGHFALQKITKLPINYLKIDGQLIGGTTAHQENEAILEMIVSLAKNMQISIFAEGVDLPQQKNMLQKLGCDMMQGKLFGAPEPAETFDIHKHF